MRDFDRIYFKVREDFRKWLVNNHETSQGIWLIFYKKHTKRDNIAYNEAVEEAICFGWIDSIITRIDEEKYVRKFTPRTNTDNWSDTNKIRAAKMINNEKMTEAGLNKIGIYLKTGVVDWKPDKRKEKGTYKSEIPDFIIEEFSKNEPALTNFLNLAPIYKRHYILWITDAKRKETIFKRLNESIDLLKKNRKLGLK